MMGCRVLLIQLELAQILCWPRKFAKNVATTVTAELPCVTTRRLHFNAVTVPLSTVVCKWGRVVAKLWMSYKNPPTIHTLSLWGTYVPLWVFEGLDATEYGFSWNSPQWCYCYYGPGSCLWDSGSIGSPPSEPFPHLRLLYRAWHLLRCRY